MTALKVLLETHHKKECYVTYTGTLYLHSIRIREIHCIDILDPHPLMIKMDDGAILDGK